jgi:hypothetical protein
MSRNVCRVDPPVADLFGFPDAQVGQHHAPARFQQRDLCGGQWLFLGSIQRVIRHEDWKRGSGRGGHIEFLELVVKGRNGGEIAGRSGNGPTRAGFVCRGHNDEEQTGGGYGHSGHDHERAPETLVCHSLLPSSPGKA